MSLSSIRMTAIDVSNANTCIIVQLGGLTLCPPVLEDLELAAEIHHARLHRCADQVCCWLGFFSSVLPHAAAFRFSYFSFVAATRWKPKHSYSDFYLRSSGGTSSNDYSPVGLGTSRPVNGKFRVFVRNGRSCMTSTVTTKRAITGPSELCGIILISGYCIATRAKDNDRSSGPSVNLILAQFFSLF